MAEKTHIKGKDSDLESSICTMQKKLKSFGFDVEESSWLNPVQNCYSVHIKNANCDLMYTNGKGASKKASLASALGEYFERLSNDLFFADFYFGKEISESEFAYSPREKWTIPKDKFIDDLFDEIMDEFLWDYFNKDDELKSEHLYDFNVGDWERGICSLPYTRLEDNAEIFIPVNIIYNIFASNGMSAGNTKYETRAQALSEVVERYVKNKIIAQSICLPEVPAEVLNRFPNIMASCKELENYGYHLRIADASLGGKYPVLSVTLLNSKDGGVFASFGAHPCFEVALERTVTELVQGRRLDQLDSFACPSFYEDEISSAQNIEAHFVNSTGVLSYDFFKDNPDFDFVDWNREGSTHDEYEFLKKIIEEDGFKIYLKENDHFGVYACQVIVPGMSDIYPIEDLIWNNKNEGAIFRKYLLNLQNLSLEELKNLLERLEDGAYPEVQSVAEFIGIIPDKKTLWSTISIGEIKALLSLALQEEEAISHITSCNQLDLSNNLELAQKYRCLLALLEIKWDLGREYKHYQKSLELLFTKDLYARCLEMVEGQNVFLELYNPGLNLKGFGAHHQMLEVYKKAQLAKLQN